MMHIIEICQYSTCIYIYIYIYIYSTYKTLICLHIKLNEAENLKTISRDETGDTY
jgi:hypothetical protein